MTMLSIYCIRRLWTNTWISKLRTLPFVQRFKIQNFIWGKKILNPPWWCMKRTLVKTALLELQFYWVATNPRHFSEWKSNFWRFVIENSNISEKACTANNPIIWNNEFRLLTIIPISIIRIYSKFDYLQTAKIIEDFFFKFE